MAGRFSRWRSSIESLVLRIGGIWSWLIVSLALLLIVSFINPVLLASYIWAASKITMAGAVGYGFDLAAFKGQDPRHMPDGLERSMAQSRRGVLIASAMIAVGLIG